MTEEPIDGDNETAEPTPAPTNEVSAINQQVATALNAINSLPVRSVSIVFNPETGELILNTSVGMPRHELLGLLEAVRDETRK